MPVPEISELESLPVWASSAYGARALRRVQPLRRLQSSDNSLAVEDALLLCELYSKAKLSDGEATRRAAEISKSLEQSANDSAVSDVQGQARSAALSFVEVVKHLTNRELTTEQIGLQALVAKAAHSAVMLALEILGPAHRADLELACSRDYHYLKGLKGRKIKEREGYLEALWPDGSPKWFEAPTCDGVQLELVVEVPEGITDNEVITSLQRLASSADDIHRALGGHGLQVVDIEIFEDSCVLEGIPNG